MEEEQALNRQPSATAGITMNDVDLSIENKQRIHVVVLQHGFQGSQYDMRLFRDYLITFPHFKYLIATSNQNDTDLSFEIMGGRLAKEIQRILAINVN